MRVLEKKSLEFQIDVLTEQSCLHSMTISVRNLRENVVSIYSLLKESI